jgi:ubiquinone/menaquinone biosynthesis C-methylase UbiE
MIGIELSQKMVDAANAAEREAPLGIKYRQGDVRKLELDSDKYDLVTAVFVFNYVVYADMLAALHEIYRITKPGGAFVFSIPHPSFPFIGKKQAPFYFDFEGRGYFSGRDSKNEGERSTAWTGPSSACR